MSEADTGRLGKAADDLPGGAAVLAGDEINTERFSRGPRTELAVQWWNRRVAWQVLREPTGHRVVVRRVEQDVWTAYALTGAGIISAVLLGLMLFGSLPVVYGILLLLLCVVLGYGYLLYEQKLGGAGEKVGEIYQMDSILWSGLVAESKNRYLGNTKKGQQERLDLAVAKLRKDYEADAERKRARGENPGKFPEMTEETKAQFLDPDKRLTTDQAYEATLALLSTSQMRTRSRRLYEMYLHQPDLAESMGRGVRDCECAACAVNAHLGVVPAISGAEAAARRNKRDQAERRAERATMRSLVVDAATSLGVIPDDGDTDAREAEAQRQRERAAAAVSKSTRSADPVDDLPSETVEESDAQPAPAAGGDKKKKILIGTGAFVAALALVVGIGVVFLGSGGGDGGDQQSNFDELTAAPAEPAATSTEPTTSAPETSEEAEPEREPEDKVGDVVKFSSDESGDRDSGAGVIAAYQHAYYIDRDAKKALGLWSGDRASEVADMQDGIDGNPEGTRYELEVTTVIPGEEYEGVLKVFWPGIPDPGESIQVYSVRDRDGEYRILRSWDG